MPLSSRLVRYSITLVIIVLAGASLACSLADRVVNLYLPSPAPTIPTPTQTPAPTEQPVPLADQLLIDQSRRWDVVYQDTFVDDEGNWMTGLDDNDYLSVSRKVELGRYTWDATAYQAAHAYVFPQLDPLTDFSISVDLGLERWKNGGLSGAAGVDFRMEDDSNKYSFIISGEYFSISKMISGTWVTLIDWTFAPAIQPYRSNQIQVIAQGSQFSFLINEKFVASLEDYSIESGKVALSIELYEATDQAIFSFDNFEVRAP